MTKSSGVIESATSAKRALFGLNALLLTACATATGTTPNGSTMNNQPPTLWQTIETLAKAMPFTPERVQQALGTPMSIKAETAHMTQWAGGGPVVLGDNLRISGSSLALGPDNEFNERSGLSLDLDGACVTLDQVRQHFDDLQVTQAPRGHSGNESTVHVSTQPWGRISFAFRANNPDCLFRVGIRPVPQG